MIPTFLRFRDIKARQIADSWSQLKNLQEKFGFPTGRLIGPHTRAWTENEIADWLASRPTEKLATPEPHTVKKARAKAAAA